MQWVSIVEDFVARAFQTDREGLNHRHLVRTVFWLKELFPQADEAMLVAALAHDIERAFPEQRGAPRQKSKNTFLDPEYLRHHQERGAEIVATFLLQQGAGPAFAERVRMLISKHEVGGSVEQDILKDADSVSFFENNVDYFLRVLLPGEGADSIQAKFAWMYDRISAAQARRIAQPWYEEGIRKLALLSGKTRTGA